MYVRPYELLSAAFGRLQPSTELRNPILIAPFAVALATLARLAVDPVLRNDGSYLCFAIAVVIAALYAGAWAGIAAILISIPICDFLFVEPRYTWFIHDARADSIMLVLFAALGMLTTFIIDRLHDKGRRLKQSLVDLQRSESQLEMIDANIPEALFTATEDGVAEYVNAFFAKYSGREAHSLMGVGWLDLVEPGDRDALLAELSGQQNGSEQFERIIRLRRFDGTYRSFKCHARRREDSNNNLKKWFGVCSDVQNEETLAEALERRTQQLLQLNQSLERFAYAASHDLQEPLRTIRAMTELFLSRKRGELDPESTKILALVVNGADRMKRLIGDIMELAKATNAASDNASEANVNAIVESAVENLGQAINESSAKIAVDPLPIVCANESALLRLFQNLIANAIKYRDDTPPEIRISAELRDEDYVFSIKDNGIGIDPAYSEKIFEPFRRLHGRSRYEGSGLGLAACHRIVESLNGKIWVESKPGEGATFFFTIPKHASREAIMLSRDSQPTPSESGRAIAAHS